MKAIGAGAALGVLGWSTFGSGADDGGGTTAVTNLDEHTGTVHDVQTLIEPSTNQNRPADFFYEPTGLHVAPGDVVRWTFTTPDHNVVAMHPAYGMRRRVPLGVDAYSSPLLGFEPSSIPGDMIEPPTPPAEGGDDDGEDDEANQTTVAATTTETPGTTADGTTDTGNETTDTGNMTTATGEPMPSGPVPDTWLLAFDTPGVYDMICSPHEVFGMAMRVVVGDDPDPEFETSDPDALSEPRAGPVGLSRMTLTDPALEPDAIVDAGTVSWSDLEANSDGEDDSGEDDGGEDDGGEDDSGEDDGGEDDGGEDDSGEDDGGEDDGGEDDDPTGTTTNN
jgi:plastocyanin